MRTAIFSILGLLLVVAGLALYSRSKLAGVMGVVAGLALLAMVATILIFQLTGMLAPPPVR